MTVTTTVSSAEQPAAVEVERADGDDVVAVDDGAGVVHGDQPVAVAVEGQAERRPRRPRTACGQAAPGASRRSDR